MEDLINHPSHVMGFTRMYFDTGNFEELMRRIRNKKRKKRRIPNVDGTYIVDVLCDNKLLQKF